MGAHPGLTPQDQSKILSRHPLQDTFAALYKIGHIHQTLFDRKSDQVDIETVVFATGISFFLSTLVPEKHVGPLDGLTPVTENFARPIPVIFGCCLFVPSPDLGIILQTHYMMFASGVQGFHSVAYCHYDAALGTREFRNPRMWCSAQV